MKMEKPWVAQNQSFALWEEQSQDPIQILLWEWLFCHQLTYLNEAGLPQLSIAFRIGNLLHTRLACAKKADLLALYKTGVVPKEHYEFFKGLPSSKDADWFDDGSSVYHSYMNSRTILLLLALACSRLHFLLCFLRTHFSTVFILHHLNRLVILVAL